MSQKQDLLSNYLKNEHIETFINSIIKDRTLDFSSFEIKTRDDFPLKSYIPEYVIEFKDVIVLIEFQNDTIDKSDLKKFRSYVSLFDMEYNEDDKELLFNVVSTELESKNMIYKNSEEYFFEFPVFNLNDLEDEI